MYLNKFEIEYRGAAYEYDAINMTWYNDGQAIYPRDVPNEVRVMRDELIDTVSGS